MALRITNTLSREKEEFTPLKEKKVSFYQCGPTVYWVQQIGNLRAMLLSDLIVRSLKYLGYSVTFVRNYTDVGHLTGDNFGNADLGEDRMEKASRKENLSPTEVAEKYIKIFEEDISLLNIVPPDHKPRATEYISEIVDMVETLLNKGFAYKKEKAIYFDVSKVKNYTKLSGQKIEENKIGAGFGDVVDIEKKNPQDFAIWFFKTGIHKNALQTWQTPWGEGFPGWHIECSVMVKKILGETIDIHMGGVEHIPIHHTNEIAQSESANDKRFVRYWLHNEHLVVDNKKMGKSEENAYMLSDVLERKFNPLALRYFFLQAHYRSKQNFTWESLKASENALNNLVDKLLNYEQAKPTKLVDGYIEKFKVYLEDDFNVPSALALLWDITKSDLSEGDKIFLAFEFDKVFGLDIKEIIQSRKSIEIPEEIRILSEQRQKAKLSKDYDKADKLRQKIEEKGYIIRDAQNSSQILPK
jgi:cysteinyl-tRNA synthetase